jgi:hypothetical protein
MHLEGGHPPAALTLLTVFVTWGAAHRKRAAPSTIGKPHTSSTPQVAFMDCPTHSGVGLKESIASLRLALRCRLLLPLQSAA